MTKAWAALRNVKHHSLVVFLHCHSQWIGIIGSFVDEHPLFGSLGILENRRGRQRSEENYLNADQDRLSSAHHFLLVNVHGLGSAIHLAFHQCACISPLRVNRRAESRSIRALSRRCSSILDRRLSDRFLTHGNRCSLRQWAGNILRCCARRASLRAGCGFGSAQLGREKSSSGRSCSLLPFLLFPLLLGLFFILFSYW